MSPTPTPPPMPRNYRSGQRRQSNLKLYAYIAVAVLVAGAIIFFAARSCSHKPEKEVVQLTDTTTVYVTKTGERFHVIPDCKGLETAKTIKATTYGEATAQGRTLCGYCQKKFTVVEPSGIHPGHSRH